MPMMMHQASSSSASSSDGEDVSIGQSEARAESYSNRYKRRRVADALRNAQTRNLATEDVCNCRGACVCGNGLQVNLFDDSLGRCGCNGACNCGENSVAEPVGCACVGICICNDGIISENDNIQNDIIHSDLDGSNEESDFENDDAELSSLFDKSISSDDEVDNPAGVSDFKTNLADWVTKWKINQNAADDLLNLLRNNPKLQEENLPKSCRTLLKTPRSVTVREIKPGVYYHFGIFKTLEKLMKFLIFAEIPDCIEILVNIDGLPLAKSSGSKF